MTVAFRWSAAQTARLKADYPTQTADEIATAMGVPRRVVSRKVSQLDLWALLPEEERLRRKRAIVAAMAATGLEKRGQGGQFIWTEARQALLRRLYVVDRKSAADIAKVMGCRPHDVSRKASLLGLASLRPAEVRVIERESARQKGVVASALARARGRAVKPAPILRERSVRALPGPMFARARVTTVAVRSGPSAAELIAGALAAGKLTVLPPGHACGTTRWESMLHTASLAPALSSDRHRQRAARRREASARATAYVGGA